MKYFITPEGQQTLKVLKWVHQKPRAVLDGKLPAMSHSTFKWDEATLAKLEKLGLIEQKE